MPKFSEDLSVFLNNSENPSIVTNTSGEILGKWLKAQESHLSNRLERSTTLHDFFDEDQEEIVQEFLGVKHNASEHKKELYLKTLELWVEVKSVPLNNINNDKRFLFTFQNIQEKRTAFWKLQQIKDLNKIGYWSYSFVTSSTEWDEVVYDIFGVDPSEESPAEDSYYELVHPEDRDKVAAAVSRVIESKSEKYSQRIIRKNDGEVRWVTSNIRLMCNEAGYPLGIYGSVVDITEDKLKEIQQEQNERMLLESQKTAKLGSWQVDLESDAIYWSPEIFSIFEIPPQEVNGKDFGKEFFTASDWNFLQETLAKSIESRTSFDVNVQTVTSSGKRKWVRSRGKVLDIPGQGLKLTGTFQDIDKEYKNEIKSRRHTEVLRTLNEINANSTTSLEEQIKEALKTASSFLKLPIGIVSSIDGEEYKLLSFYDEHEQLGLEKNTILNLEDTFCSITYDSDSPVLVNDVSKSEFSELDCYKNFPLGSYVSVRYNVYGQPYGTINFSGFETRDDLFVEEDKEFMKLLGVWIGGVIERMINAEKLRLSQEEKQFIFDNTQTLMCTHDLEGKIITINKSGAELSGYQAEKIIGKNIKSILDKNYRHKFDDYLKEIKAKGNANGVMAVRTATGEKRIWFYKNALKCDERGKYYVVASSLDITERIAAEEKMKQAKEEAEKASKAKAEFLSTMSHEIRTPLNAVVGLSHLLIQDNPKESQISNLKTLLFSAENLLSLINDILDFSKIESGKIELEKISFSLFDILRSLKSGLKSKADENNVSLNLHVDEGIPTRILGDSTRLTQIFNNLLSNAIKFTNNGRVDFTAKILEDKRETLRLYFEVKDNGVGISKDKLYEIFKAFSQENAATTRQFGGTGLGLSITKKLIEIFGSEIKVESEKGKGSKFFFELEVEKDPKSLKPVSETEEGENSLFEEFKGLNILVAEDNPINVMVLEQFLKKWEIELHVVTNGLEAVNAVGDKHFDLIFMDLQMPKMDGLEATKKIKALGVETPIIALTASALTEVKNQVRDAGMEDFVSKPFDPKELNTKIARAIRSQKAA